MQVREWMTQGPDTVGPETPVEQVREVLGRGGYRHVPVVEDGRLVGMVSDRDVRGDRGPTAADVMSRSVQRIDAAETVEAAARLLLSRRISALPVVDGEALVGIITTTDCLLALLSERP